MNLKTTRTSVAAGCIWPRREKIPMALSLSAGSFAACRSHSPLSDAFSLCRRVSNYCAMPRASRIKLSLARTAPARSEQSRSLSGKKKGAARNNRGRKNRAFLLHACSRGGGGKFQRPTGSLIHFNTRPRCRAIERVNRPENAGKRPAAACRSSFSLFPRKQQPR